MKSISDFKKKKLNLSKKNLKGGWHIWHKTGLGASTDRQGLFHTWSNTDDGNPFNNDQRERTFVSSMKEN